MINLRHITFLILLFAFDSLFSANFRFRSIDSDRGLSNNKVNVIHKDSLGFVWIGSGSGLNRWDGYEIKTFYNVPGDSASLTGNYISDIQETPDGKLWIYSNGRYSIFDPETETFDRNVEPYLSRTGFKGVPSRMVIDGNYWWLYHADEPLTVYNSTSGTVRTLPQLSDKTRDITYIAPIPGGERTAVIDSEGRLSVINNRTGIVEVSNEMSKRDRNGYKVFTLYPDKDGLVWVFSENGIFLFDSNKNEWIDNSVTELLRGHSVTAVTHDNNGMLWVGLDNEGILVVDRSGAMKWIKENHSDSFALANNSITTILNDDEGTIWVGTFKKGMSVYNESEFKFDLDEFPDVNFIVADPTESGSYWIGTDAKGLIWWNRATGQRREYRDGEEGKRQFPIVSIEPSSDGGVWVGSYRGGLKKFKDGRFHQITNEVISDDDNVWSIIENKDGTLWIGFLGKGIIKWDPSTGSIVRYTSDNSRIPTDYVNSMDTGADGKIYVGTSEGLAAIDQLSGRLSEINPIPGGDLDLRRSIIQVCVDSRGLVWLATQTGLLVYNPSKGTVQSVTGDVDLSNAFMHGIAEDTSHTMWATTGNSVVSVKPVNDLEAGTLSFEMHKYNHKDGLQASAFNQRTVCVLDNGDVVAGGLYGLNRISPNHVRYNLERPKVVFTGLSIYDQPVEIGVKYDGNEVLKQSMPFTKKIVLNHNQNNFTINFTTDSHVSPEYAQFTYMLKGFSNKWITGAPGVHSVSYTNLEPGSYTLVVKAVNSDGVSGDGEASLVIVIRSPWWATWFMKCVYMILLAAGIWLIYNSIKRNERRRFIEHQKEENARKQEELNQMKFKFYTNVSHELRTPLTLILSPVESMMKEHVNDERTSKRLSVIHSNASKLLSLVNQLLDFRKSEVAALTFNGRMADMVDFVKRQMGSFVDMAEKKGVNLTFHSDFESLRMLIDADKMSKIINNLLSNALKFTPEGGFIKVSLVLTGNMLRIIVADSGKGISDEEKIHVFDRFYQSPDAQTEHAGSGIGLNLVKEYVRLHEGDVWVTDTPGGGATLNVDIPVRVSDEESVAGASEENAEEGSRTDESNRTETAKLPVALVVDDNKDLLDFLKDELSDDFKVIVAADGVEALEKLAKTPADIIVSDIMMPRMDGIELCRRLKTDKKTINIPLIMVTAKHDERTVVEGLTLGADDYITKPFNNEVLKLRMKKLVELRRKGAGRTLIEPEPSPVKITSLDEKLIERAVKYVEENIGRSDLSVEELSRQLGMSRVHLYKKILQLTGKTPIEFIRILRLKRAAQYLRESQLNVSEIAYKLGFNNPKYFSRYFQDEYGISPSEYQKKEGK